MRAISDNVTNALRALTQNWLRSVLTISGIVVGVVSIVTLVAILQGVKAELRRELEGLGANIVVILPSKLDENGQPNPMAMLGISSLTDVDVEALRRVPGVAQISPVVYVTGTVQAPDGRYVTAYVVGTNREGVVMNPTPLQEGRYFTERDENSSVCVLANQPALDLFGRGAPLGRMIRIQGRTWRVVGVLRKPADDGSLAGHLLGLNNLIYLPVAAVRREIPGGQVNRIVLKTDYNHPADKMVAHMNAALRASHGGLDNFGVITEEKGLGLVIKVLNLAQSLLVLVAAISLFVAGVGIMNIMLVTVTERTREIGVRKTVGARRADIFAQFLTEAVTLSLIGGIGGLALAAAVCGAVSRFSPLTPQISTATVGMALGVCTVVGVLFGVAPAVRAARLDPIDAMRHE